MWSTFVLVCESATILFVRVFTLVAKGAFYPSYCVMSVRLLVCLFARNSTAPSGQLFVKLDKGDI